MQGRLRGIGEDRRDCGVFVRPGGADEVGKVARRLGLHARLARHQTALPVRADIPRRRFADRAPSGGFEVFLLVAGDGIGGGDVLRGLAPACAGAGRDFRAGRVHLHRLLPWLGRCEQLGSVSAEWLHCVDKETHRCIANVVGGQGVLHRVRTLLHERVEVFRSPDGGAGEGMHRLGVTDEPRGFGVLDRPLESLVR